MRLDQVLDDIFASGTHVKVLRALCALPHGMSASGRDLARRARVSHPRAAEVLAEFADLGVALVNRLPRTDLYQLNGEHVLAQALIQLFAREPRLKFELLALVDRDLKRRKLPVTEARLFGSVARGESTSSSDVDLALVCPRQSVPTVESAAQELADMARRRFGTRLNVLVGSPSLTALTRKDRPGYAVWRTIEREGVALESAEAVLAP